MIFRRLRRTEDRISGPTLSVVRVRSRRYRSARELADHFGAPVFQPTWWPEGTRSVYYRLEGSASNLTYRIGSKHRLICIIGGPDQPRANLPIGNWYRPPELEAMDGLVNPHDGRVQGVVHIDGQTIHLIGYASEAELVQAAKSFQRVSSTG